MPHLLLVCTPLSVYVHTHLQFVMNSMTQVLAQTVYSLNLNDLPLNRLELEDSSQKHRPRIKTVGSKDLPSSLRMESFSVINALPSAAHSLKFHTKESNCHSDPLLSNRVDRVVLVPTKSKRTLKKANTVEANSSPTMDGHPGMIKRTSMPENKLSLPSHFNIGHMDSLTESSTETLSDDLPTRPSTFRSISAIDVNYVEPEYEAKTTSVVTQTTEAEASPGTISLPADFLLKDQDMSERISLTRGTDHAALLESGKELVFVNHATDAPTSELVSSDTMPSCSTVLNSSDSKAVAKGSRPSGKVAHPVVLDKPPHVTKAPPPIRFLFHTPWSGESSGGKLRHDKQLGTDLVLMNENLTDMDLGQLKLKQSLSASNMSLNSESESQLSKSAIFQKSDMPDFYQRKVSLVKSSSEGNINRILLNSDMVPSTPTSLKSSQPHSIKHIMQRMLNSNPNSPSPQTNSVTDPFSSEIIPRSHKGVLGARSPSPVMGTVGYGRKVSVERADKGTMSGHLTGDDVKLMVTLSPIRVESAVNSSTTSSLPREIRWTPVITAITWLKMLRIIGDINDIKSPDIHSEAMTCLQSVWKSLFDVSSAG